MLEKIRKLFYPHVLTDEERKKSLYWVVWDGILTQLIESLTGGAIMVAIALSLGASNAMIGYLVSLPFLANLSQFPGAFLVEKIKKRKLITILFSFSGRFCLVFIAFLLFFPKVNGALYWLGVFYTGRYCGACLAGSSWNSWMKDLIPEKDLGQFFSKRLVFVFLTAILCSLLTAFFLKTGGDVSEKVYGILILTAFIGAVFSLYVFVRIDEPPMDNPPLDVSFLKRSVLVFRDENYRRLLIFLGVWHFAVNLAVPFFTVVLLNTIGLSVSFVLILTVLTQVMSVLVMGIWGKISDSYSNKTILLVSVPLYLLCIFLFIFVGDFLTVFLLLFIYTFMGIAQAGITLATNNIALKLAPRGRASVYLSMNGIVNALTAGTAPLIGGFFADYFSFRKLSFFVRWENGDFLKDYSLITITHWDFYFLFACILGILSLPLLKRVKEDGEVTERVVLSYFIGLFSKNFQMPQKLFLFLMQKQKISNPTERSDDIHKEQSLRH